MPRTGCSNFSTSLSTGRSSRALCTGKERPFEMCWNPVTNQWAHFHVNVSSKKRQVESSYVKNAGVENCFFLKLFPLTWQCLPGSLEELLLHWLASGRPIPALEMETVSQIRPWIEQGRPLHFSPRMKGFPSRTVVRHKSWISIETQNFGTKSRPIKTNHIQ